MAEEKQQEAPGAVSLTKMRDISSPAENDILCGRSKETHHHPGNLSYRGLVNLNKSFYASCEKSHKGRIAQGIVAAIRAQKPPGRFLVLDPKTSLYYDIGDKKAIEKTSQALREGQPKTREKIQQKIEKAKRQESRENSHRINSSAKENDAKENDAKENDDMDFDHFPTKTVRGKNDFPLEIVQSKHRDSYFTSHCDPSKSEIQCEPGKTGPTHLDIFAMVKSEHATSSDPAVNDSKQALYDDIGASESNEQHGLVNNTIHHNKQQKRMSSVTVESMTDLVSLEGLKDLQNAIDTDVPRSPSHISIEKDYDVFSGSVSTETLGREMKRSSLTMEKTSQPDFCVSMGTVQSSLRSSAFAHDVNQDDLMSVTTDLRSLNMSTMGESVVSNDLPDDRKIDYESDSPIYNEREHKFHQENNEVLPEPYGHTNGNHDETNMKVSSMTNSVSNSFGKQSHASSNTKLSTWGDSKRTEPQRNNASVLSDFTEMSNMTAFRKQLDGSTVTHSFGTLHHLNHAENLQNTGIQENHKQEDNPHFVLHNPENRRSALARSWGIPRKNEQSGVHNNSSLLSEFTTMTGTHEYDASEDPYI